MLKKTNQCLEGREMEQGNKPKLNDGTDIVYSQMASGYLPLLSLKGTDEDIGPLSDEITLEPTELLTLDREEFRARLDRKVFRMRQEIKEILQNPDCILSAVRGEAMDRIIPHITREHYSPQHVILKQGDESTDMFCIARGRCDVTRSVVVPEAKTRVSFFVGPVDQYGCFGQECVLQSSPSLCTVTTTCLTTVLKINRQALQVVVKDQFFNILSKHFHGYPSDQDLRVSGYHACLWNEFKHKQVKQHLVEAGACHLLLPRAVEGIRKKEMSNEDRYRENFRRFILHGANYEPVTTRIRSAYIRRPTTRDASAESKNRGRKVKSAYERQSTNLSLYPRGIGRALALRTNEDNNTAWRIHCSGSSLDDNSGSESGQKQFDDPDSFHNYNDVFFDKNEMEDDSDSDPLGSESVAPHVVLRTKDNVKKDKTAAEKFGQETSPTSTQDSETDSRRWYASIQEELDRLSRDIVRDKERTALIRRYLDARASQRQCERNGSGDSTGYDSSNNNDSNTNKQKDVYSVNRKVIKTRNGNQVEMEEQQ